MASNTTSENPTSQQPSTSQLSEFRENQHRLSVVVMEFALILSFWKASEGYTELVRKLGGLMSTNQSNLYPVEDVLMYRRLYALHITRPYNLNDVREEESAEEDRYGDLLLLAIFYSCVQIIEKLDSSGIASRRFRHRPEVSLFKPTDVNLQFLQMLNLEHVPTEDRATADFGRNTRFVYAPKPTTIDIQRIVTLVPLIALCQVEHLSLINTSLNYGSQFEQSFADWRDHYEVIPFTSSLLLTPQLPYQPRNSTPPLTNDNEDLIDRPYAEVLYKVQRRNLMSPQGIQLFERRLASLQNNETIWKNYQLLVNKILSPRFPAPTQRYHEKSSR